MAKRKSEPGNVSFNVDLDKLLTTEFLDDTDKSFGASNSSWNKSKKVKTEKKTPSNPAKTKTDASDERNRNIQVDMSKLFESVGNNFNKSLNTRKERLTQFSDLVLSAYTSKIVDLLKRQETEFQNFKIDAVSSVSENFKKFENDFEKLKQQESKLSKILEQHLKLMQTTSAVHERWQEQINQLHQGFVQTFEEIRKRHKSETLDLTKSISQDIRKLQNDFLLEMKNEEMKTMQKYLSAFCF